MEIPIAHGERHGVPNQYHTRHRIPAQLPVAVDQVVDAQRDAARVRQRQQTHRYDQSEPMHLVRRSHAPEQERSWHEDKADGKGPQALFGFHDSVVASRESDREPVAEAAGEERAVVVSWFL